MKNTRLKTTPERCYGIRCFAKFKKIHRKDLKWHLYLALKFQICLTYFKAALHFIIVTSYLICSVNIMTGFYEFTLKLMPNIYPRVNSWLQMMSD